MRLGDRCRDSGARYDAPDAKHDVEGLDRGPRGTHALAEAPPQPIPVDGSADHLASDDETDTARRLRGRRGDQLQEVPLVPGTGLEYGFERADAPQAMADGSPDCGRRRNERQTESRARPFARRADRTLRPPTVFMRARKPCVRARRIFDG